LTSPPPLENWGRRKREETYSKPFILFSRRYPIKIVFDEMTKFHECYLKISIISPIPSENAVSCP